jgi:transcriptional regulator GlxA family with amidase domain
VLATLVQHVDEAVPLASREYVRRLPGRETSRASGRLGQVLEHVAASYADDINFRDACDLAAMTPAAFSRFFHKHTGRTFTRYVQEVRIGQACRRLVETDEPVTAIAFAVGFLNVAHFNRTFKREKGVTPSEWRRRINELAGLPGGR